MGVVAILFCSLLFIASCVGKAPVQNSTPKVTIDTLQVRVGEGENNVTIDSPVYGYLDNMTLTFFTEKTTVFLFMDNYVHLTSFAPDPYGSCATQWQLDGDFVGETVVTSNILNAYHHMYAIGPFDVEAGQHIVKLYWKTGSSNQTWVSTARSLEVVIFH